jgi:hypothetical protein
MLEKLSLQTSPIWNDVPREMQLPCRLSRDLLWKCPCPQPHSTDPCDFEVYLRRPSQQLRDWLCEDELNYLVPPGVKEPEWDIQSPRLHNILIKMICFHYASDHLEKAGIYIRNVSIEPLIKDSLN